MAVQRFRNAHEMLLVVTIAAGALLAMGGAVWALMLAIGYALILVRKAG